MTLSEIQAECYRRLSLPSSPAAATATRILAFVNDTLQEIISEPGMGSWIDRHEPPFTFASVANQAVYGLNIPSVLSVMDRTNDLTLEMRTRDWYRAQEPDPTANTGTPSVWVPLGFQAVSVQPSDASQLFVISTSASDGAGTTAVLEGYRTGGYITQLQVAMNGITAASFSAAITDIIQVTKFFITVGAVGTVTLREDSGVGTTLATIPIGQTYSRYHAVALWPTPSAPLTYHVDADRDVPSLSNNLDQPPIPVRFHRLLVEGAIWREFLKTDDDRRAFQEKRYYRGLSQMRHFLTCPPDFLPSRGQMGVARSRFGANFPATKY